MLDLSTFEAFEEEKPFLLLDTHPDGKHLALQVATDDAYLAAIWNADTKSLVWSPEDAHALTWLQEGRQIAALQNPILSTNFQFTLYSWPQGHLLQHCELLFPMGYLFDLIISPLNDLALCRWLDQTEFGFEFVDIFPYEIRQDVSAGFFFEGTNDVSLPVFSPNGLLWACWYKINELWWADDPEEPEQPVRGGKYNIGALLIFQGKQKPPRTIPLIATIPPGWPPPDPLAEENFVIADPYFLDDHRIQIQLPSGEVQIHQL